MTASRRHLGKGYHEHVQRQSRTPLSRGARRAITLLWHAAHRAGLEADGRHRIEMRDLCSPGHKGTSMARQIARSLMDAPSEMVLPDGPQRMGEEETVRVPLISWCDLGEAGRGPPAPLPRSTCRSSARSPRNTPCRSTR